MKTARPYVILLAEDDDEDHLFFKEDIEKFCPSCQVVRARNGEEVMAYLANHTPDMIFLDKQMPKKDGLETLIEIRRNDRFRSIPVVMLTDSAREEDLVKNAFLTANLRKPVEFESIRFKKVCSELGVDFFL